MAKRACLSLVVRARARTEIGGSPTVESTIRLVRACKATCTGRSRRLHREVDAGRASQLRCPAGGAAAPVRSATGEYADSVTASEFIFLAMGLVLGVAAAPPSSRSSGPGRPPRARSG